jgi:hypothetical protein
VRNIAVIASPRRRARTAKRAEKASILLAMRLTTIESVIGRLQTFEYRDSFIAGA